MEDKTDLNEGMENEPRYPPITVAVALSLYGYNVPPIERARKLYDHFDGACWEVEELVDTLLNRKGYEATELPFPTANVYVQHALERYGREASTRVTMNKVAEKLHGT